MAFVRSYLCVRYDIEAEFAKTIGRDERTIKLVRDIAIL